MGPNAAVPPGDGSTVQQLKGEFAAGAKAIQARHDAGAAGGEVIAAITQLCDRLVTRAYAAALGDVAPQDRLAIGQELTIAAVGGFGRAELAPHSDIDLLFLHAPTASPVVAPFIARLVRDLWDIGMRLSQGVQTPEGAVSLAGRDFKARTSLNHARRLAGSEPLFDELRRRLGELAASTSITRFLNEALAVRSREHSDYHAETVYLLEPNVKKSPGALRDVHLFGWLALARYGTDDAQALVRQGVLKPDDAGALAAAAEFLRRIRNELHYRARAAQDVLGRDEQVRLAAWLGFEPAGPLLGVERFMQQYYLQTTTVYDIVMRMVERLRSEARRPTALERSAAQRLGGHFVLKADCVGIDPAAPPELLDDAMNVLELFDLARRHGRPVEPASFEAVREAVPRAAITPATLTRFLACLAEPIGIGAFLRNLHRTGLLCRLLPAFEHARCLIQFNVFHHYTVDEHSIRAVEMAARRQDDPGPLGQAYRETHRKDLLHLALLLHDLGKGLGDDHCEVGREIAEETARRFDLSADDRHLVVYLVHEHLLMAHTSLRRDIADVKTVVRFARSVATPKALRMLYLLTAADTEAVAPGEWTAWKESLLSELYFRAAEELTGTAPVADEEARARAIRERLANVFGETFPPVWLGTQLAAMPFGYLLATEPERVEAHLHALRDYQPGTVRVLSEYDPPTRLSTCTVITREEITPGIFSKVTGVLAASGFQIVDAQIVTRSDGVVIDTFRGTDADFADEAPPDRKAEIAQRIEDVLCGRETVESLLARRGRPIGAGARGVPAEPPQVEIDTDSSDRFTIIDVFAEDRPGLLYTIARTLFECGLSVYSARISTHYDQVVDAFYVTARDGTRVTDPAHLDDIRRRLLESLG